ncbi:TPA: hypothetical protein ACU207_002307 [Mannheimia haemolytica]|uniref:hypothetical protein n=1 Tax=Mannheimia haemolytica TaxID=75985 RepID=UPI000DA3CE1D|nr:hypothetical protein [Mannheimia haemolytica]MCB4228096.1 hypothetical protein [Mannheimia haemolytica]MEE3732231.1 hypothetical protein [Mannheimia haemolytica]SQE31386.1 Uncharacterised protein [Mannheimia haemolytica]
MSLKSKLSAFTTAYKNICKNSQNAWQNTDCSISEEIKASTKIKFALWTRDKSELASGYQTSGYAGEGFYSYGVYEDDD